MQKAVFPKAKGNAANRVIQKQICYILSSKYLEYL